MTLQEKIELAEKEVKTAETMVAHSRNAVADWEKMHELRSETLAALKAQAKPVNRKAAKQ